MSLSKPTMTNTMWIMKEGVLHTTNNGWDRNEKPMIPFAEYLQDVAQIGNKQLFMNMTSQLYKDEVSKLPEDMKRQGVSTIVAFCRNYDEWKQIQKYTFSK